MRPGTARLIFYGQVVFCVGLAVTIYLQPQGLLANDGISYYGVYRRTVVPYAIAILGTSVCYWSTAGKLLASRLTFLRYSLMAASILAGIIVITPYTIGSFFNWTHMIAGSCLFILQLVMSGWFYVKTEHSHLILIGSLVELAAGIGCALYLNPSQGLLLQCQVIFQLAFAIVLANGLELLNFK